MTLNNLHLDGNIFHVEKILEMVSISNLNNEFLKSLIGISHLNIDCKFLKLL